MLIANPCLSQLSLLKQLMTQRWRYYLKAESPIYYYESFMSLLCTSQIMFDLLLMFSS